MVNLLNFGGQNLVAKDITKNELTVVCDGSLEKVYKAKGRDGQEYEKHSPVLKVHFQQGKNTVYKDFVLNRENREFIIMQGITDLDELVNGSLVLEKKLVDFNNQQVFGIRISEISLAGGA